MRDERERETFLMKRNVNQSEGGGHQGPGTRAARSDLVSDS